MYFTLFSLTTIILALQIILSSILRAYIQIPFLAISFALLGLSAAGIYIYLRFSKNPAENSYQRIANYIDTFGSLLFIFFIYVYQKLLASQNNFLHELITAPPELKVLEKHLYFTMKNSLIVGVYFALCFYFLGLAISLIYRLHATRAPKLYFFDLLGAAFGCILGNLMISYTEFSSIPIFISLLAFLTSFFLKITYKSNWFSKSISIGCLLVSIWVLMIAATSGFLKENPIKGEVWSQWNSYSRVTLQKYRDAKENINKYRFALDNGVGFALLTPFDTKNPYGINFSDEFNAVSLGFLQGIPKDLLIMFAGAGRDIVEAYSYSKGATNIIGVELNPLIINKAIDFPGHNLRTLFEKNTVRMIVREGRSFLESTDKKFDSIIFSWAGASTANFMGTSSYTGQYLYTKESFVSLLQHLKDDGTIGIVNGNKIRLLLIFKEAFKELNLGNIKDNVILFDNKTNINSGRSYEDMFTPFDQISILIKKTEFTPEEITRIQNLLEQWGKEFIYTPQYIHEDFGLIQDAIVTDDANIHKMIKSKYHIEVSPVTDNNPFIANLFDINKLVTKKFWKEISKGYFTIYTLNNLTHIYTVLFIGFIILCGFAFILLPLILTRRTVSLTEDFPFLYLFSVLGFGYILVEISVLNQFVLFLGNPTYAFSFIIAGLLLSTGLGSVLSNKLFERGILNLKKAASLCFFLLLIYYFMLSTLIHNCLGFPLFLKFILSIIIIFPLGLCLGMLFPQGLKKLNMRKSTLIPWAWGINGYTSVMGSSLSIYLSMMIGFNCSILIASILYLTILLLPGKLIDK